jgi:predicted PurR-regulated permease PerM
VIAVSFAALWLVTFILLIRARFLRKEISSTLKSGPQNLLSNDDNLKTQLRNLKENLKKNNAKNSYSDWQKIVNLLSKNYEGSNHFNELIKNKNLEKQINLLSLALYKKDKAGSDWQGHNMLAALKNVLDSIEKNSHKEKQLPPLYPQ